MITSFLKAALRNLKRRRGYSFINIAGLTLGLTGCLLIFQYVAWEFSFDSFNTNAATLFRVTQTESRSGGTPEVESLHGYALGPALAQDVPEVVQYARLHIDYGEPVVSNPAQPEKVFEEKNVCYADPSFLTMFTYPLVHGDPAKALAEPGTLLISESAAQKYFGSESPLGKVLHVTGWISGDFRVNGVLMNVPSNSHLQFDFLLSMADLLHNSGYNDPRAAWTWQNFSTYVQLRPAASIADVEKKCTQVLMNHRRDDFERTKTVVHLNTQLLKDVHLNDGVFAPRTVAGSYRTVYFFIIIGLVTLVIALVNYVNLVTARSLDRAREVGVRKVIGAQREHLVLQFLLESALTNFVAMVLAIAIAELLRPFINNLGGIHLGNVLWAGPRFWLTLFGTFCATTLLAGLYPAFALSSFKPVTMLKGRTGSIAFRLWLRRGLVVLQFSASIALLAGTAIIYAQLNYVQHMDLGMNLEQILTVPGPRALGKGADESQATRTLIQALTQIPSIRQIATSTTLPGKGFNRYSSSLRRETADPATGVRGAFAWIDTGFANLYGLKLVAGNPFEGVPANAPQGGPAPVIANEAAIKAVGINTPADALDQVLHLGGRFYRVVGVFGDFNWSSAHSRVEAALFGFVQTGSQLSIKVNAQDLPGTIAAIKEVYGKLFPNSPFDYSFMDEKFDEQYRNDERFAGLYGLFAGLAMVIGCLGLFGLAAFSAQQRRKEIGIRKVLGASLTGIVALLSKELLSLVLLANLVAWPVTYVVMSRWLQDFAYRIDLEIGVFLLAGLAALATALFTVSFQAIKAAIANPVEALHYE